MRVSVIGAAARSPGGLRTSGFFDSESGTCPAKVLFFLPVLTMGPIMTQRLGEAGSRTDETYSINQLPSYDLTNIRGGVDGGRWSAVLFVNNIADKRVLLNNITQDAVNLATYNRVAVSQPRTTGIDLNYRFGK